MNDLSNRDEQSVEEFDCAAEGEARQTSSLDEMMFSVEELVTRFMTLEPGLRPAWVRSRRATRRKLGPRESVL